MVFERDARYIFRHTRSAKQDGNGPGRRPVKSFQNMQKNTIVEVSSILQCQKIPKGICKRLENYFSPNVNSQKTHLGQQKTSKNQLRKKINFFQKMSPVSRIEPKTLRSSLCSQNFWSLVKIEGGIQLEQIRKKSQSSGKALVLKTRTLYPVYVISGIQYIQFALNPVALNRVCAKKSKGGPFCNIEKFSRKRYIRCTLHPELVISGLR